MKNDEIKRLYYLVEDIQENLTVKQVGMEDKLDFWAEIKRLDYVLSDILKLLL